MIWETSCGNQKLNYDEACLKINTNEPVSIFSQITECYKCELLPLVNASDGTEVIVNSVYPTRLLVTHPDSSHFNCSFKYFFSQSGVYGLNITNGKSLVCSKIFDISPGTDVYKPLWILMLISFLSFIVWCCILPTIAGARLRRQLMRNHPGFRDLQNDLGEPIEGGSARLVAQEFSSSSPSPVPEYRPRVKAIDAFRGIAVILMIFVNSGGGNYSIFQHSPWNGLTVADLLFPWFVWIMGFSTVMSVKNQIRADRRRHHLFCSSVRRSLILFVLGIVLNSMSTIDMTTLRIPGVLQRIALTYFIIASLEICFVTPEYIAVGNSFVDKVSDLLSCWAQWTVIITMVGVHTYLSLGVGFEGCPPGYLGAGGLSESLAYVNCTGGIASYLDRKVFTPSHMLKHPTPQPVYHTSVPVDPEGLLGTLTSCLTAFLGVQAGQILLSFYNPYKRLSRWTLWAHLTGIVGGLLCGFTQEGGLIPVNKNLWSLSYSLISSSFAFLILLALYFLIDHLGLWSGTPFVEAGRNSILLYFCSCVLGGLFPFKWKPLVVTSTHSEYLAMNTFGTLLWIVIACILARRKVYLTI